MGWCRSLRCRVGFLALGFFVVMPALAGASCQVAAQEQLKVGRRATIEANLSSTAAEATLRLAGASLVADNTTMTASKLRVGPKTSIFDARSQSLQLAKGAELRGDRQEPPSFPLPFCPTVLDPNCGGPSVLIKADESGASLSPGSYGRVQVGEDARLTLEPGDYFFCELRVRQRGRLSFEDVAATRLSVAQELILRREAILEGADGAASVLVEVAGQRAQVKARALLAADLRAPAATLQIRPEARLVGNACAAKVLVAPDVTLACPSPTCGDAIVQTDRSQGVEQCDQEHDAACPGACAFDCRCAPGTSRWQFQDVTTLAGARTVYATAPDFENSGAQAEIAVIASGVAVGDADGDGWLDLFTVGGALGRSHFLHNAGDGTFEDRTAAVGLSHFGVSDSGPAFADLDGDRDLDLVVGSILGGSVRVYENKEGVFEDVSDASGLTSAVPSNMGASFGDADGDGDLDLFLSHWFSRNDEVPFSDHLWLNNGAATFEPGDQQAGFQFYLSPPSIPFLTWTFTGTFADMTEDGLPDLLVAADFGTERYFVGQGDGSFEERTGPVNSAENAMGQAIADYDNDGDLDWFLTSIWDPDGQAESNWGVTGNRLYRNLGDGTLEDVTEEAGVREGYWGWGACFADFNLDGWLDLFHVNGFAVEGGRTTEFDEDPSRLFLGSGDGTFVESSVELGIDDRRQGRGIVCFDYDRDGDIDIFIANGLGQPSRLYRNDAEALGNFLEVRLLGASPNTEAAGARVYLQSGMTTQMREIQVGGSFVGQNPAVAHFGLGPATVIDELTIVWPDGEQTVETAVAANQFLERTQP